MQKTIAEFNSTHSEDDLFLTWQTELRLRRQIRSCSEGIRVAIEDYPEFQFLKRCLYFGFGQDLFFDILYQNTAKHTVLTYIMQSPPHLISGFLGYISRNILKSNPSEREMQFLITMYQEKFRPEFIELISQMDHDLCTQLLVRTSNDDLRSLLNQRLLQKTEEGQVEPYELFDSPSANKYPTIYGDKIEIIMAATKALKAVQTFDWSADFLDRDTVEKILDIGDMLFRAGLLADCLALLTKMVTYPGMKEHSLIFSSDEPYYQQLDGLLRKTLPIYALLVSPTAPHYYALELYRGLFPGFGPDPASLVYLDIHAIVMASLQGHRQYANYEIAQKGGKILSFRPDDLTASILLKSRNNLSLNDLDGLQQAIRQRMPYRPHEVYIIMEILRLWQQEGRLMLNRSTASDLLNGYLHFFNWIPAAPFLNEQVLNQLGALADEKTRIEAASILFIMQDSSPTGRDTSNMRENPQSDPESFNLRQRLLLSKYMGVF